VALIFRNTNRDRLRITNILKNWRKDFSDNQFINKARTLVPGFLIWDVWKDRNGRIFKNKIGSTLNIIAQILRQLKDNIGSLLGRPTEDPTLP